MSYSVERGPTVIRTPEAAQMDAASAAALQQQLLLQKWQQQQQQNQQDQSNGWWSALINLLLVVAVIWLFWYFILKPLFERRKKKKIIAYSNAGYGNGNGYNNGCANNGPFAGAAATLFPAAPKQEYIDVRDYAYRVPQMKHSMLCPPY